MKTSTRTTLLAFGAASLAIVIAVPASAQTVAGSNCSKFRDMDKNRQCLTRATDSILEDPSMKWNREHRFLTLNPPTSSVVVEDSKGRPHVITDGPGYRIVDGVGSGAASILNTRPGRGGSGGKRSTN